MLAQSCQRVVISLGNTHFPQAKRGLIAQAVQRRLYHQGDLFGTAYSPVAQRWIDAILKRVQRESRWHSHQPVADTLARATYTYESASSRLFVAPATPGWGAPGSRISPEFKARQFKSVQALAIQEVASQLGFRYSSHFCQVFRQFYGVFAVF